MARYPKGNYNQRNKNEQAKINLKYKNYITKIGHKYISYVDYTKYTSIVLLAIYILFANFTDSILKTVYIYFIITFIFICFIGLKQFSNWKYSWIEKENKKRARLLYITQSLLCISLILPTIIFKNMKTNNESYEVDNIFDQLVNGEL